MNATVLDGIFKASQRKAQLELAMKEVKKENEELAERIRTFTADAQLHREAQRMRVAPVRKSCTVFKNNPDGTFTTHTVCAPKNPRLSCKSCTLDTIGRQRQAMMIKHRNK